MHAPKLRFEWPGNFRHPALAKRNEDVEVSNYWESKSMMYALDYQSYQEGSSFATSKRKVTEAEYWEKYYDNSDVNYEWNNGYLEEKPVSDHSTYLMFKWFFKLIDQFLSEKKQGELAGLEMGFRLQLSQKTTIRKPDLGVVAKNNPVQLTKNDSTYHGIFDICIEALSDSSGSEITRDTITKKAEYAAIGVAEYYILYGHEGYTEFYHLDASGIYRPMPRVAGEIIQSVVLPGFQFRISDLHKQPSFEEMINDPVYQDFVLPGYSQAKQLAYAEKLARQKADLTKQKAEQQAQKATKTAHAEKLARQKAEQQAQKATKTAHAEKEARQKAEQQAQKATKVAHAEKLARQKAEQQAKAEIAHLKALLASAGWRKFPGHLHSKQSFDECIPKQELGNENK